MICVNVRFVIASLHGANMFQLGPEICSSQFFSRYDVPSQYTHVIFFSVQLLLSKFVAIEF